jgi:glycosyltransferase involved in cell wall biosynthesis
MKVVRIYHAGRDAAHRERDRALVRAGVDVTLIVPAEWPGGSDEIGNEQFEVVELPVLRPGDVNRHRYREFDDIVDVLDRVQPDLLDLHEEPFSAVVRQILRKVRHSLPAVSYAAQNIDKRFPPPFAQWERAALMRLGGIYPCTRQAASVVVGKGFPGHVRVLPLAPPPQIAIGHQQAPTDELHMLLVGRLVPEKGVTDAVETLAALRERDVDADLTVVGDGPERDAATALAERLNVAHAVELRPWASAEEIARHYANAHVLLAPSRRTRTWVEQFGRMVVEALAAGAVVVGYATGSLPEVVGDAGVLVPEGDVQGMADAIAGFVADPIGWKALRVAGLRAAPTTTWDAVARGQRELYEQVLTNPMGRRRVRPRRRIAAARYGPPAEEIGGARPFALPVLRNDTATTRALARSIDRITRRELQPPPEQLKVVYLDHVARMSGGEVALARLIGALPEVDAHVILAEDGPLRPVLERTGATVEVLPLDPRTRDARRSQVGAAGSLRLALSTLRYTLKIARRLRQLEPDLVHTNSLKSGYYGALAAQLARKPVVWHLRDRIADDYLPRPAVWLTRFAVRTLPDLVICNSAETFRTAHIGESSAAVVASPVVHDPYEPSIGGRARRAHPVVGILGRLSPWKGQDVFLHAFATIARTRPYLTARVIGSAMFGEDDYAESLHRLAAELGIEQQVTFVGFTAEVERELAQLDILVHASTTPEPFGQVIVEGMAAGLAVVASAAGGPLEIITHDVDGLLVPAGDAGALAAALARLVEDEDLRRRLGSAGMERARDFSPERIGNAVLEIYRGLLLAPRR